LPENKKQDFYNLVLINFDEFRKWQNTLVFLETIDERNYTKYFLIPYKKKALCLNEQSIVNINYSSLMNLIGKDSKVFVSESGEIKEIYWGDTLSSVLYVEYSDFAKENILELLVNKQKMIAECLSFCDESDYADFQQINGDFLIEIDKLMRLCNIKKDASKYLSEKFELSKFKSEVVGMETELSKSDFAIANILPF